MPQGFHSGMTAIATITVRMSKARAESRRLEAAQTLSGLSAQRSLGDLVAFESALREKKRARGGSAARALSRLFGRAADQRVGRAVDRAAATSSLESRARISPAVAYIRDRRTVQAMAVRRD